MGLKLKIILFDLRYVFFFSPSLLMVTRQEFRIEFQFMLTDFDGDDEGRVFSRSNTVDPGTCCSCCAVDMYRKFTVCRFQMATA